MQNLFGGGGGQPNQYQPGPPAGGSAMQNLFGGGGGQPNQYQPGPPAGGSAMQNLFGGGGGQSNQNQTGPPAGGSAMQRLFGGGGGQPNQNQTGPSTGISAMQNLFGGGGGQSNQNQAGPSAGGSAMQRLFGGGGGQPNQNQPGPSTGNSAMQHLFGGGGGQQNQHQTGPSAFRGDDEDDNVSRLELEYPIENVHVAPEISSSVAMKVNEAVEKDRWGHHYRANRFIYEPVRQQLTFGTGEYSQRNPQMGERHIHEIPYYNSNSSTNESSPDDEHYTAIRHRKRLKNTSRRRRRRHHHFDFNNSLPLDAYYANPSLLIPTTDPVGQFIEQLIRTPGTIICKPNSTFDLNNQLVQPTIWPNEITHDTNLPVNHYVAHALPNDPMRIF
ncbi:unnamed protein product [Didymodactylos carnosus]|uniref:Uncharacterized protein n=1 Tax=Didymodactylos carnosus TaxID=1234261 RepID=A0A815TYV4_9BILA|nr:unnamed protein product [Didymodactylos carnosus]CAF4373860.1 unnamed protein product [Didymodactylos carnosus]